MALTTRNVTTPELRPRGSRTLRDLGAAMNAFVEQQGWYGPSSRRPQTPRNLATSLAIECAELLECFQWSDAGEVEKIADEVADVVLYAAQLAGVLGIDLDAAVFGKLERNYGRTWDSRDVSLPRRS